MLNKLLLLYSLNLITVFFGGLTYLFLSDDVPKLPFLLVTLYKTHHYNSMIVVFCHGNYDIA